MSPNRPTASRFALPLVVAVVLAAAVAGASAAQQANEPPTASFTYSPAEPQPGQTLTLNASASSDPDGEIVAYRWDFDGDNQTDAEGGPNRRIAFPRAGSYAVGLTVEDDAGDTHTVYRTIRVVGDQPPTARLDVSPTEAIAGDSVSVDATGSSDPDGQIATWELDTDGDGTFDERFDSPPSLQLGYGEPGTYEITLRVTDNDGMTDTTSVTLTVAAPETTATGGDGGPTTPATTAAPTSPASEPDDGDGVLASLDRAVPGGLAAGIGGLVVLLLVIGGGAVLTRSGRGRSRRSVSVGPLGVVGLALGLVVVFVGLPIVALRNRVPSVSGAQADLAVALLELAGLALVAVVVLLLALLQYARHRADARGQAEAIGPLSPGEFRWLTFVVGFLATAALTVGIAIGVLALELAFYLNVVAWLAVAAVAVVPLALASVLVLSAGGRSQSVDAAGWQ